MGTPGEGLPRTWQGDQGKEQFPDQAEAVAHGHSEPTIVIPAAEQFLERLDYIGGFNPEAARHLRKRVDRSYVHRQEERIGPDSLPEDLDP